MQQKYNGWSNRATWVTSLWCDSEGISAQQMREYLEEKMDTLDIVLRDIISPEYASINWQEIEQKQSST